MRTHRYVHQEVSAGRMTLEQGMSELCRAQAREDDEARRQFAATWAAAAVVVTLLLIVVVIYG
jgi:hypothetical protein